ncbi:MAG TPA: TetR family transcriptional regulator C-terminal domain-containing protein [Pseudonocardia sp.]|nr:TetR family transcriptional regulator C-terminal domain-containing protein [Pseudonocardia sp.]
MAPENAAPALTPKGLATKARIVEQAAELMYTRGVHATSNDLVRRHAGVSGSQLAHYFPDKQSLVDAVIAWRAEQILRIHHDEKFSRFESIGALRQWADFYIAYERACQEGCTLGSLANEVIKGELHDRDQLKELFEQWRRILFEGLERMRDRGRLRPDADPAQLANSLMAALQGGMLLAQLEHDMTPLRDALTAAVDHVESFTVDA